ncbi:MAG: YlxM family DNA-binding protein [Clostridia bacterium]
MKEKSYEMTILFDFYGDILTEKQHELFDLYYNEDLSLAEIAEHVGITRQGVRDGIVRAEEVITKLEATLGLAAKFGKLRDDVRAIESAATHILDINETNFRSAAVESCARDILAHTKTLTD